jgi:sterol desaturase/sphingolipid hydroxylase (fatty acid hydroxylase superfamily)
MLPLMSFVHTVWEKFTGEYVLAILLLWFTAICSMVVSYYASGLPRTWQGFRDHAIPPGTLTHPSARADVLFWISRKAFNAVMAIPAVVSAATVGLLVHDGLARLLPNFPPPPSHASAPVLIAFSFTMFIAYDFSYYVYHNMQHRIPVLWEIHKVHHSAEVMVGFTKDRVHPLDDFMNHAWDALITGVVYGIWLFFLLEPAEVTIFGLNIYILRNILMLDLVRHTHYKISFGKLINGVILCPHWHQLHHSTNVKHYDKNFGLMLSVWDRMFNTLMIPEPNEDFAFGLTPEEHPEYRSATRLWLTPFVKIYAILARPRVDRREGVHDNA